MARSNSNTSPNLDDLMDRLYDSQALIKCAASSLDENKDVNVIRVLRRAEAVTLEVINRLDEICIASCGAAS